MTMTKTEPLLKQALKLARGAYQRALIEGDETWSGSSLKGKAKKWSSKYARSRKELLARLMAAKVAYLLATDHGFQLELGTPPSYYTQSRCAAGPIWTTKAFPR